MLFLVGEYATENNETRDHIKNVDADIAARDKPDVEVEGEYQQHCNGAQSIDFEAIGAVHWEAP